MFSLIQLCKNKGFSSLLCGWHGLPGIVIEMDFWRKKGENKFLSCGKYISLGEVFVIVTIQQRWITSWPLGSAPRSHHRKHWSNKYKKEIKTNRKQYFKNTAEEINQIFLRVPLTSDVSNIFNLEVLSSFRLPSERECWLKKQNFCCKKETLHSVNEQHWKFSHVYQFSLTKKITWIDFLAVQMFWDFFWQQTIKIAFNCQKREFKLVLSCIWCKMWFVSFVHFCASSKRRRCHFLYLYLCLYKKRLEEGEDTFTYQSAKMDQPGHHTMYKQYVCRIYYVYHVYRHTYNYTMYKTIHTTMSPYLYRQ